MQIDIPAHIEKLLFLHDALVIPGFGGFTATRTPASTDYVGGVVHPPAKTLAFSENLTVDDGLLTADIADAHGLNTEDARKAVEEFVDKIRDLLDQRDAHRFGELLHLHRYGRLREIKFFGSTGKAAEPGDGLENFQLAKRGMAAHGFRLAPSTLT